MNFFKRYDKNIIEEFALRVISKSYESSRFICHNKELGFVEYERII